MDYRFRSFRLAFLFHFLPLFGYFSVRNCEPHAMPIGNAKVETKANKPDHLTHDEAQVLRRNLIDQARADIASHHLVLGHFILHANFIDMREEREGAVDEQPIIAKYNQLLEQFRSLVEGEGKEIPAAIATVTKPFTYQGIGGGKLADMLVDESGSCNQASHAVVSIIYDSGHRDEAWLRHIPANHQGISHLAPILKQGSAEYDLMERRIATTRGWSFPAEDLVTDYAVAHGLEQRVELARTRSNTRASMLSGQADGLPTQPPIPSEPSGFDYPNLGEPLPDGAVVPLFAAHIVNQEEGKGPVLEPTLPPSMPSPNAAAGEVDSTFSYGTNMMAHANFLRWKIQETRITDPDDLEDLKANEQDAAIMPHHHFSATELGDLSAAISGFEQKLMMHDDPVEELYGRLQLIGLYQLMRENLDPSKTRLAETLMRKERDLHVATLAVLDASSPLHTKTWAEKLVEYDLSMHGYGAGGLNDFNFLGSRGVDLLIQMYRACDKVNFENGFGTGLNKVMYRRYITTTLLGTREGFRRMSAELFQHMSASEQTGTILGSSQTDVVQLKEFLANDEISRVIRALRAIRRMSTDVTQLPMMQFPPHFATIAGRVINIAPQFGLKDSWRDVIIYNMAGTAAYQWEMQNPAIRTEFPRDFAIWMNAHPDTVVLEPGIHAFVHNVLAGVFGAPRSTRVFLSLNFY